MMRMILYLPALLLITACGDTTSRLDGAAFEIDFTDTTLSEPAGAGPLMDLVLADLVLVVQFASDESSTSAISAVSTLADGVYTQDPCSRTVVFDTEVTWEDPNLTISASNWVFEVNDLSVPMRTLEMTAVLSEDGKTLTGYDLNAFLDSEDFTVAEGATAPCDQVGLLGIDCFACDDDPTRLECLSVELLDGAPALVELESPLVVVTAADVAATAACAEEE